MPVIRLTDNQHRIAAVILLLFALVGLYALVDRLLVTKYEYYRTNIEQLQDRLQKYNSILATREDLESRIQQIRQDNSVDVFYLKSAQPTLAATDLQQRVKGVVEAHGGNLVSTQILPVNNEGTFTKVAIRVQMLGDTETLQKVLYDLESARPLLFINDLQITARQIRQPRSRSRTRPRQPLPPPVTQTQLTARFELVGYMRGGKA